MSIHHRAIRLSGMQVVLEHLFDDYAVPPAEKPAPAKVAPECRATAIWPDERDDRHERDHDPVLRVSGQ